MNQKNLKRAKEIRERSLRIYENAGGFSASLEWMNKEARYNLRAHQVMSDEQVIKSEDRYWGLVHKSLLEEQESVRTAEESARNGPEIFAEAA